MTIGDGRCAGITVGRRFDFPKGSVIAMDRGYADYAWFKKLNDKGIYFVTRLKRNAHHPVINWYDVRRGSGVTSDQTIEFTGTSRNAVLTQIWIAMCVYLILAFLKLRSKLSKSLQQMVRLLQMNLFDKIDLMALARSHIA